MVLPNFLTSPRNERFRRFDDEDDEDDYSLPHENFHNEPRKVTNGVPEWSISVNDSTNLAETKTPIGKPDCDASVVETSRRYLRTEKLIFLFAFIGLSSMAAASVLAYRKWSSPAPSSPSRSSASTGSDSDKQDTAPITFSWEESPSLTPTSSPLPWIAVPLPSETPVVLSTLPPTVQPTIPPTVQPTIPTEPSYFPGNLTTTKLGLTLSHGLDARLIAITDQQVPYDLGGWSNGKFHDQPDAGATYPDTRPGNQGGWIYVSNSEVDQGKGGVGAITFDKDGNVIDYSMLLRDTSMNCGGGRTPWQTWVSCEEVEFTGQIYQVDPLNQREPQLMTLGSDGGRWESFAFDVRDKDTPHFFATEDHSKGCVRRFTPDNPNWDDPWSILHGNGTTVFLMITPNATSNGGTYEWTSDKNRAKSNAKAHYPMTEGIDVHENQMFFVCKKIKMLFVLDLDSNTYYNESTVNGLFDGTPDQMQRILGDSRDLVYFTEEGGVDAGVHARDHLGRYYTVFESPVYPDETTGLSFSPDGRFMYTAYQDSGLLYAIWRTDGLPFHAGHLDIKFHHQPS